MAHFAKLDENNVVTDVVKVNNEVITENGTENEQLGIDFLRSLYNEPNAVWKQTSYNTREGTHRDSTQARVASNTPEKAFRKNYAGKGYTYDEAKDAFIPPKPAGYSSWVLNETKCIWEAPVAMPITYDTYFKDLNDNLLKNILTNEDLTIERVADQDIFLHGSDPYDWNEETQSWIRYTNWNSPITPEQQTQFETVNADYLNSL